MMQGAILGGGTLLAKVILLALLLWSVLLFIKCISYRTLPQSLRIGAILVCSFVIYGLFPIAGNEYLVVKSSGTLVPPFSYMKGALMSITPIYAFYYYARSNGINTVDIRWLSMAFLCIAIVDFYYSRDNLLAEAMASGSNREEFTNNVGYVFLGLFPYVYYLNRKYALPYLAIIVFFIVSAMKRGAVLIGLVCVFVYLYHWLKDTRGSKRIIALVGILSVLLLAGIFILNFYENSMYFQARVDQTLEGNLSGRDKIAESMVSYYFKEATFLEMIFGCGANGTLKHASNYAHNDWLEMLMNQGLVGVVIQLLFYSALFFDFRRIAKIDKTFYYAAMTLFIIVFFKTMFSMSICNMRPEISLIMGFVLSIRTNPHLLYENRGCRAISR